MRVKPSDSARRPAGTAPEEHFKHLHLVLERISAHGILVKIKSIESFHTTFRDQYTYDPSANGLVKLFNRQLKASPKCYPQQDHWTDSCLKSSTKSAQHSRKILDVVLLNYPAHAYTCPFICMFI